MAAMRARRAAAGLIRTEVYVHADDQAQIKALESFLNQKREKLAPVGENPIVDHR